MMKNTAGCCCCVFQNIYFTKILESELTEVLEKSKHVSILLEIVYFTILV